MRLRIRGEAPRLRLTFDVDGTSATHARMRVGGERKARVVDLPFESSVLEPELDLVSPPEEGALQRTIVRFPGAADRDDGLLDAHVYTIPERSENVVDLEPGMRARLRALGYVE